VTARASGVVEAASSKEKKGETLVKLSTYLQPEAQTLFIAGINFKGFTVRNTAVSERGQCGRGRRVCAEAARRWAVFQAWRCKAVAQG
jgi:hypothetical protein